MLQRCKLPQVFIMSYRPDIISDYGIIKQKNCTPRCPEGPLVTLSKYNSIIFNQGAGTVPWAFIIFHGPGLEYHLARSGEILLARAGAEPSGPGPPPGPWGTALHRAGRRKGSGAGSCSKRSQRGGGRRAAEMEQKAKKKQMKGEKSGGGVGGALKSEPGTRPIILIGRRCRLGLADALHIVVHRSEQNQLCLNIERLRDGK